MIHCRPCSKTEMNLFKNISMAIKVDGDNKTGKQNLKDWLHKLCCITELCLTLWSMDKLIYFVLLFTKYKNGSLLLGI